MGNANFPSYKHWLFEVIYNLWRVLPLSKPQASAQVYRHKTTEENEKTNIFFTLREWHMEVSALFEEEVRHISCWCAGYDLCERRLLEVLMRHVLQVIEFRKK